MLADMRTKPCSGTIISRSNKCMTGFIFYPTSETEHYQFMRLHKYIVKLMDYQDNILHIHTLTWIMLAQVIKYHWWNRNVIDGTRLISSYLNIHPGLDKAGSWSIMLARDQWNENIIDVFYRFFKSWYLKYHKYIESEHKFKLSISNEMWQHIFRSAVRLYIFTFFGYVPGSYFDCSRMW